MKYFFLPVLLIFIAFNVSGQKRPAPDSVNICGHRYKIPADLKLTKPQELTGSDYSITWTYIKQKDLEKLPGKAIASLSKQYKNFNQTELYCYLLFQPCKAYGLTFDDETGARMGQAILFATVNNQPVYVQIKLINPVFENEKMPAFVSRIMVLNR